MFTPTIVPGTPDLVVNEAPTTTQNTQPTVTSTTEPTLGSVLVAVEQWRKEKHNSSEPIPDTLCRQIFALETTHSSAQLRRLFGMSAQQYQTKRDKLLAPPASSLEPPAAPNSRVAPPQSGIKPTPHTAPKLCHIKIKPDSPYAVDSLPIPKTMVVEFCRSDGKIMKIHITQDSIQELIHTFFGCVAKFCAGTNNQGAHLPQTQLSR